ncbi:beta-glucosidase [Vibrio sp. SCSIO 43137]|uniref:beta-glucosidase n=1 Tax=Vibrio sp. SCSIO 43137 TaxID=3021011 RepID=UPI00230751AD|nr:glycoside hydrolase family 3 C-terminal domain-containing protein [Vibrio sp. SCSIO 43137]WCE28808.1 glycoside hydrolase family 3 C-terminal domain-containing protein [Vibrio sp. SCSIO 43137]
MSKTYSDLLEAMDIKEKITLLTGNGLWQTAKIDKHNIDSLILTDGTYGVRYSTNGIDENSGSIDDFIDVVNQDANDAFPFGMSLPATCFPNGCSVACSWDVDLIKQMGNALAEECKTVGVDVLLGPGINIRRTPLAGRGYEYYSEDPVLSGELAAGLINGMQKRGVAACLKHFACNNSEYKRTTMDSLVDERALREIYLAGFKRTIDKSDPWSVMSSYNRLNGVQTSHNKWLLNSVLREEWGYQGMVISDWFGVKDCPAALLAGNDLSMPETQKHKTTLLAAFEDGQITEHDLDTACHRVLSFIDKAKSGREAKFTTDYSRNHKLAQQIASESIVLLKNDNNLLPLLSAKHKRIAVLGESAQLPVFQGSGCATTRPYFRDCPLDEIIELAGEHFDIKYAKGTANDETEQQALSYAQQIAQSSDVAIIFVNTIVGEDGENGDRENLDIIPSHQTLIESVSQVQPNIVVVLANSDAVTMPWINHACSILETFFAGQGMGGAVAQILFGHANPCGKLTVTMPHTLEETPAYLNYPGDGLSHTYGEGIFVGYRYYDKRNIEPLFPFGFGMSYTEFTYSNIQVSTLKLGQGESVTVTVDVTNVGKYAGKEIVQLYLAAPAGVYLREKQALKGFSKIHLKPAETKNVSITLEWDDFCFYHPKAKSWKATPGKHSLIVAKSSRHHQGSVDIAVEPEPYYETLNADSTLSDLIENPAALAAMLKFISSQTGMLQGKVYEELKQVASFMFFGLDMYLIEELNIKTSKEEINKILEST